MSAIQGSLSSSIPIIQGELIKTGQGKSFIQINDNYNNILFNCLVSEDIPKKERSSSYKQITLISQTGSSKNVLIKIDSIEAKHPLFQEFLKNNDIKKNKIQDTFFDHLMNIQSEAKLKKLNDASIRVKSTHGNERLNSYQINQLNMHIEMHKDDWIKEANEKKHGIVKKIRLDGLTKAVSVEIYPDTRKTKDKYGQIDIRTEYIDKGNSKKVYKTYHYEKDRVKAGAYIKDKEAAEKELNAQARIASGTAILRENAGDEFKEKLVISKSIDQFVKQKGEAEVIVTKHVQKKYETKNLSHVLESGYLPDGTELTTEIKRDLMVQTLQSLQQLHEMGLVHRDVKRPNILLKEVKTNKTHGAKKVYEAVLADYDLVGVMDIKTARKVGTPFYIPIEVLVELKTKGETTYTVAGDIFCVGRTFDNEYDDVWWDDDGSVLDDVLLECYQRNYAEEAPEENTFEWGLWKMTLIDPSRRFQSTQEAINYFNNIKV